MVQAMLLGGLRRCEVLGLRLGDVNAGERRVFIADGKGGRQRIVPVSSRFFAALGDYLDDEQPRHSSVTRLWNEGITKLLRRINPARRRRANPRVVKRKVLKWAQPTQSPICTILNF
jgi:integrase